MLELKTGGGLLEYESPKHTVAIRGGRIPIVGSNNVTSKLVVRCWWIGTLVDFPYEVGQWLRRLDVQLGPSASGAQ